ncbi:MAG: superoxide dismutase [Kiritimatiellae bacterium]|nr:superoxide dismutase [Kiritimatiellia bacterium]
MLSRRDALRAITLTSLAAVTTRWLPSTARAQTPDGSQLVPPPPTGPSVNAPFSLPPLPFAFDALEPHIDARTMEIHHDKHHAAYVNNLNKAVENHPDLARRTLQDLISNLDEIPEAIRTAIRNNGGGHFNHTLFWNSLQPQNNGQPEGDFDKAIRADLGGIKDFMNALSQAAMAAFGSGWAWLSLNADGKLIVESLPNQDSPLMHGRKPIFGIDVWEHAYYLHYQNRRADYIAAIWNIVDWPAVSLRYSDARSA